MGSKKPEFSVKAPVKVPSAAAAFVGLGAAPGDTQLAPAVETQAVLKAVPDLEPVPTPAMDTTRSEAPASVIAQGVARAGPERKRKIGQGLTVGGVRGRREQQRADGEVVVQKTFYVTPELARRLAVHCAEVGRELSAVASEALEAYLEKKS